MECKHYTRNLEEKSKFLSILKYDNPTFVISRSIIYVFSRGNIIDVRCD